MPSVPINPESGPQAVLELIYRLKVREAMSSPVITAEPADSLRAIQHRMRDNRITGIPVVEGRRLVGLVSIGDVIEALDAGRIGESAERVMSRTVISLEEDMPLAFATTYFNRYRYGRFPVLDKEGGLVGIICASDIIRALLVALNKEVARLEEKLSSAAGAPVQAADGFARLSFPIKRFDFESAGAASAEIKRALRALGIDDSQVRRAAVASYELELNQVIHSEGGSLSCVAGEGRIEILAKDCGPGIPDVEAAMTEGFSTANEWIHSLGFGAGMGLPNAKRVSDDFSIDSGPGRGTEVRILIRY